jgi:HSP20 family molecular chaperone IbpA
MSLSTRSTDENYPDADTLRTMERRKDLNELQQQIQELFSDLWQVPRFSGLRQGFRPQADCYRTDDPPEIHVIVELAGVDPEQVQIVAKGRTLVIAGARERPHPAGARVQQMEVEYGPFQRQLQLAEDVDTAAATASYERGLLRITLPLAPAPVRQVKVPIVVRRQA